MNRRVGALFLLALSYHFLLVVFSVVPPSLLFPIAEAPIDEPTGWRVDLLMHMFAYMLLTLLWSKALARKTSVVLLAVLTGGVLEVVQAFLPWRSFSGFDFLANMLGIAIAAFLSSLSRRIASLLPPPA